MQWTTVKEVADATRSRMDKVVEDMQHAASVVRTGRASINLLEPVRVDYYGTPSPLNQVATLHVPEPTMITIQPWDASMIRAIEKAIRESDLGFNPSNDGKLIRVPVPALTEERRRELVKQLHATAEEHRVAVRGIRRDSNEALKKMTADKVIGEDEEKRGLDEVQKLTDAAIARLDSVTKAKEKEVMEV
ncbi:MAG: ribosome recycling factor [Bryobacterales bacterium]|nr:ribosome recycling factor [Bryobacterales bacterium]